MTDGRFETTLNLRPNGWDSRHHWTKTHRPFCNDPEHVADHMERESCPFHDLRADGCFQPEYAGLGLDAKRLSPQELVRRKDGNRFATGGATAQPRSRGVGGLPIAHDVEPASGPASPASARPLVVGAPWKGTGKPPGAFSTFEHMTSAADSGPRGIAPPFFNTGKATGVIGAPALHYPEPYQNPQPYGRKPFRLSAGVARRKDVIGPAPPCPPPEAPPRRSATAPRPPLMQSAKSSFGTFSHYPPYIPDPIPNAPLRSGKRALFTYAAKTKRTMPIEVAWKHGTQASEAPKPPADTVTSLAGTLGRAAERGRPNVNEVTLLRIH